MGSVVPATGLANATSPGLKDSITRLELFRGVDPDSLLERVCRCESRSVCELKIGPLVAVLPFGFSCLRFFARSGFQESPLSLLLPAAVEVVVVAIALVDDGGREA